MKEIPLTNSDKVVLVDDEDYERLMKFKWRYNKRDNCPQCTVRIPETPRTKDILMTHEILQTDNWVDHKDGNRLDAQKTNLRECTNSQNQQNKKKTKRKTSSKYKGVHFHCRNKRWEANIEFKDIFGQRACIFLGGFFEEKKAAEAYDEAARKYFGEFAALNFPLEGERSCL